MTERIIKEYTKNRRKNTSQSIDFSIGETYLNTISRKSELIVDDALGDMRSGKMVIIVDDETRENEGDLCIAAEKITAEAINFMATNGRGLTSLAMTEERMRKLGLALITPDERNTTKFQTAFATPIDARVGVTSGMSAADRAHTVKVAIDDKSTAQDLIYPGRMQTLRAQTGGVLARAGHTEAAIDLARLAGLKPAAVICEIMNDDGSMARLPDLERFAAKHGIRIIKIADLLEYRVHKRSIRAKAVTTLPTRYAGSFKLMAYTDELETSLYLVLLKGEINPDEPILLRIHSQCLTGDVFGSERCDCGEQLETAMKAIEKVGSGIILYMFDEGRGIGLLNKIRAYVLQDQGRDTVEANLELGFAADQRDYTIGAYILSDLGVKNVRLMTNNPDKVRALENSGINVVERVQIEVAPRAANLKYMQTKKTKFGHMLSMSEGNAKK